MLKYPATSVIDDGPGLSVSRHFSDVAVVDSMPADHFTPAIITNSLSFAGTLWKLAGLRS
jgi:hypothetical protein